GYYIIGLPSETPPSIAEDLRTLASLQLDVTQITIVTPHPHTEMWSELESKHGIFERDWSKFDTKHLVWSHPHCAPGVLQPLLEQCFGLGEGKGCLAHTKKNFSTWRRGQKDLPPSFLGPMLSRWALPERFPYFPSARPVPAVPEAVHAASA